MKISSVLAALCALLGTGVALRAVETKYWQQSEMADFEKGTLTKLSLSSDGHLMLAPVMKEIHDPAVTFLWSVARDSKGNLYTGGGSLSASKAKLIAIDASGKAKTLAEIDGMAIQAIAVDRQDRVYAATSPDGKVYRVDNAGKVETFYDPKSKYIWAIAFSRSGDLFVATGDQGEIHRVTPAGAGSVFFKTEEAHARSLAIDANNNLIVGTDPSGLIIRITPAGEGFVLYQSPKREITAVAVAPDGSIYAAGAGAKQPSVLPPPPSTQTAPPPPAASATGSTVVLAAARPAAPPTVAQGGPPVTTGSEIYRIQKDGYPRRVWSNSQDVVYALTFDAQGRAIAGTGNRGSVYRIDSDRAYTRLMNLASTQVTGFCTAPDGKIFAVTGNIGKVISIGPQLESSGTFESDVYDAGAFTYWGRLSAEPSNGAVAFETRSGNLSRTQQNWSPWAKLDAGRIVSPAARFVQYRATLGGSQLNEVDIAYLMKNVAPVIAQVEATPANYKFPAPAISTTPAPATLTLPPLGRSQSASSLTLNDSSGSSPSLTWSKGQIGARWLATDDNGDALQFKLEIRGVNETGWKLLKEKIRERYYSWDSTAFPDGKYVLRVTASDVLSNPPDQALTAMLESEAFLIDNSAPEITGFTGTASGTKIDVRFHAKDALSTIGKAEYSINGGDWIVVEPVTRLTDSQEEDYRLSVDRASGETTIAVRVPDEYENQAVAKIVVK